MTLPNIALDFDSDRFIESVNALRTSSFERGQEIPVHRHVKCQLVMPLTGFVRC